MLQWKEKEWGKERVEYALMIKKSKKLDTCFKSEILGGEKMVVE